MTWVTQHGEQIFLPTLKLPGIADLVIAQGTQADLVGETRDAFEAYATELEKLLYQ